jgi:hypothetical protein
MTFRDLQKLMEQDQSRDSTKEMQDLIQKVRDKPFYIWGLAKHKTTGGYGKNCCFNHIIGLPKKNGVPQPLWNYQDQIYHALMFPDYLNRAPSQEQHLYDFKLRHVWIKKATGLSIKNSC